MGYANLIFDFDGTLTDSREDIAGAQLWVLHQLGVRHYRPEDLYPHIGKSLQRTFATLLPPELHHRIPEAAAMYAEYYPPRSLVATRLFPGVRETLAELTRRGKRCAVASTKRGPGLTRVAGHFGIADHFVQLQGSDDIPYKPDPAILLKILADQAWDPARTLMVGDTDNDILAAHAAGLAACGVTYGSLTREQIVQFSPEFVIDTFPEILAIADDTGS